MPYTAFVSESVCAGHPDKVCDQISDAVLDALLAQDPRSRVAVETLATRDLLLIAGEVTTEASVDYPALAHSVIRELGYTDPTLGFDDSCEVQVRLHHQSQEIAQGADRDGAGDQGLMFGYAVRETPELMPLPILLAHELCAAVDAARESRRVPYLYPDGKSEVRVRYEGPRPVAVEQVVLAAPHRKGIGQAEALADLYAAVVVPVLAARGFACPVEQVILNGTGIWTESGPATDTGLTGRKIIVDTYGGRARHGGGCFSGKDPTKVDRSGAYAARYIAKNVVAAGLADECEVRLAYVIGRPEPILRGLETFGTAREAPERVEAFAWDLLDLSVRGIVEGLRLRQPIYRATARYGHFGRAAFPWEALRG